MVEVNFDEELSLPIEKLLLLSLLSVHSYRIRIAFKIQPLMCLFRLIVHDSHCM